MRNEIFAAHPAQRVLELHQLDEDVVLGVYLGRMHRPLEIEGQPLLNATHTRPARQVQAVGEGRQPVGVLAAADRLQPLLLGQPSCQGLALLRQPPDTVLDNDHGGVDNQPEVELWRPIAFVSGDSFDTRGNHFVTLVGRLKPGATAAQAQDEMSAIAHAINVTCRENGDGNALAALLKYRNCAAGNN